MVKIRDDTGKFCNQTLDTFWDFVNKTPTCWLWTGTKTKGYGNFGYEGNHEYAHRIAWKLLKGPYPKGLEPDHLCKVPACVNPNHIEWVTHAENTRRGKHTKITREIVLQLKKEYEDGSTMAAIAKKFHLSACHLSNLFKGLYWDGIGKVKKRCQLRQYAQKKS